MRSIILTLLAVIGVTYSLELPMQLNSAVQFITREDLVKFQKNNPDTILTPLQNVQTKDQIRYTLGSRANGDRLVAQASNSQNWGTPQDVRLTLQYPTSGQGAVVTYASVTVQQSSNLGQGYVVSGGIGQRSILIYVESYSTTYLSYSAQIYGI